MNDVFNATTTTWIRIELLIGIMDFAVASNNTFTLTPTFATLENRIQEWNLQPSEARKIYSKACDVLRAAEQQ